jgi:pyridoxal phosphate enzyme (YggS family)
MATIAANLQAVRTRIDSLAQGRRVMLLAVSKGQPVAALREAAQAGQGAFGENYVQEALEKQWELRDLDIDWHFVGPIQSNKARALAEHFSWVHSVSRMRVAERLSSARPPHAPPLNICLQVNVSGEASKSGVAPGAVADLAQQVVALPGLRLRGLMTIPESTDRAELLAQRYAEVRRLQESLNLEGYALDTLSMGMSADFETAIREGATLVRIGTAVFGARPRPVGEVAR